MKSGYSHKTVQDNIIELIASGMPRAQAIAVALKTARECYFKKHPHGLPPWHIRTREDKARTAPAARRNPARRTYRDEADARRLAAQFHGREPGDDEYMLAQLPKIPDALANIGKIFAIEYLAERDGKEYRFRHVFKAKSRPHLAVSPDGTSVTMLRGAWFFGPDGFEDTA